MTLSDHVTQATAAAAAAGVLRKAAAAAVIKLAAATEAAREATAVKKGARPSSNGRRVVGRFYALIAACATALRLVVE